MAIVAGTAPYVEEDVAKEICINLMNKFHSKRKETILIKGRKSLQSIAGMVWINPLNIRGKFCYFYKIIR